MKAKITNTLGINLLELLMLCPYVKACFLLKTARRLACS